MNMESQFDGLNFHTAKKRQFHNDMHDWITFSYSFNNILQLIISKYDWFFTVTPGTLHVNVIVHVGNVSNDRHFLVILKDL